MTPNMMRQLWGLIESSQSKQILELDDGSLVNWLIIRMDDQAVIADQNVQDRGILEGYIRDHLLLIRDMADGIWIDDTSRSPLLTC